MSVGSSISALVRDGGRDVDTLRSGTQAQTNTEYKEIGDGGAMLHVLAFKSLNFNSFIELHLKK